MSGIGDTDAIAPNLADELDAKYREERDKRLAADRRYLTIDGALRRYADDPHTKVVRRDPVNETTGVLVIGGGFGGILTVERLAAEGIEDFVLLDEAGDVGGVWYWNRYPGAVCDIDAYTYLPLLEETGYMPTEKYVRQSETFAYAQALARRYGIYDRAFFHTAATAMRWDGENAQWAVETDRGDVFRAQFVVLAIGGAYSRPKLAAINGIERFRGVSFHASRWNYGYTGGGPDRELVNLHDKKVAVVGTGATALQVVPWVGRAAERLYVIQRTPSTVSPRNNGPTDAEWFKSLEPGWQYERMLNFAAVTTGEDFEEDLIHDGWSDIYWDLVRPGREPGLSAAEAAEAIRLADFAKLKRLWDRIDSIVEDPTTAAKLKPYYNYQCKRPGFHDEYLDTFNRPNVELLDTDGKGVDEITEGGIVVNGTEYIVDCIIHATGFLSSNDPYIIRAGFDPVGVGGVSLSSKWKQGPSTFQAMFSRGFPNLFIYPDTTQHVTLSYNFMRTLVEASTHAAFVISEVLQRNARYFDVAQAAEDDWVARAIEHAHDADAFRAACTPGRANGDGRPENRLPLAASYPMPTNAFYRLWEAWRRVGKLDGLELETRVGASAASASSQSV